MRICLTKMYIPCLVLEPSILLPRRINVVSEVSVFKYGNMLSLKLLASRFKIFSCFNLPLPSQATNGYEVLLVSDNNYKQYTIEFR